MCGLAEAPRARSRAAAHSSAARPRCTLLSPTFVSLGALHAVLRASPHRAASPPPRTSPNAATAYYYANYLALFKICLPLIFHFCSKIVYNSFILLSIVNCLYYKTDLTFALPNLTETLSNSYRFRGMQLRFFNYSVWLGREI